MSNELVFKLRVDGAAPTATGVAAVGAALDTLAGKGPAVSSALGSVGDALTANQSAQAAYLLGLREQIQLFGKSSIEIERYKAAQLGVGAAAAPLILQLQNQRAAQELAARAARDEAAAAREAASAKKAAEASQASFVRSLQEQVAVQGKSQADLLRYRAAQLGVAKDAEQYIAAIEKSSKSTLGLSISAGQATAAMRQLPAQFTDIATQLAGGQSPFLILLQQGGQIKDSFGGVGNAIKALGSVISPVGLVIGAAAATVGVLAIAYNKGAEESLAFTRSIILSGNAAGVTRDQLSGMATEVAKIAGNESSAAAALAALAGGGQVAASGLQLAARAAIQLEREGVQSVDKTAKAFADLAREPLAASLRLNEGVNYLTVSVIEQIRTLEQQGRAADAAAVAQNAYAASGIKNTDQLKAALGPLDTLLRGATEEWGKFWAGAAGIGRAETAADRIKELRGQLAQLGPGQKDFALSFLPGVESADQKRAQLAQLEASQAAKNAEAERAAEVAKTTQAYIKATEANKKYTDLALTGAEKVNKALQEYRRNVEAQNKGLSSSGLPAIAAAEMARVEKSIRESFAGPKGPSTFADLTRELQQQSTAIDERVAAGGKLSKAEELELRLNAKLQDAAGKLTAAQMASLQADAQKLVAKQKLADAAERDIQNAQQEVRNVDAMRQLREDGEREIIEWLRKQDEERRKGLESITARVQAVKDEEEAVARARAANISLAEAVEQVAIARLEESRAAKVNDPAALAAIENEIKARRELMGLLGTKAAREANDAAAKDALTVWQRSADQIGQSLTDALMQGGKNAWEYIKGLFRSTVLRPIIQAAVNPIVGALGGGLGLAGSANAAGNTFGAVNGASGVFSALTGGITSNLASLAASAGSLFGSTALSTFATGMQGSTLAAGLAGPTTAGAGGALGAGAAFASAVPYIAGALALFSAKDALFGRKLQDTSITGTLGGSAGFTGSTEQFFKGGLFRSNKTTTEALGADVTSPIASAATAIRDQVQKYAVALGLPVEQIAGYTEAIKFSTKGLTAEQIQTKLQESLAGFGEKLAGTLNAELAPFAASGEKAGDTLARLATSIAGVNPVLQQLGLRVFDIGTAGAAAASQLAQQFGGLEQFAQVSASYYAAYYSQAERAAAATQSITDTLAEVGLALPTTRDEFRKLVTAQDLTTTSGSAAFTALMKVQGAFAELTVAGDEAAAAAIQAAEATAKAAEALRGQLASAIDQNIGKFLSSTQMTARQYSTISNDLAAAGINVDVGQLIGLSKDQIGELASAFLASAEASDAAKLAVVTAAGALADLKDQATAAAAALDAQLRGAIDSNVDKFLTPRERVDRQAAVLSNRLASVGINIGADELLAASVAQIGQAASAFVNAAGASVEAKTAVVEVAGALVDLKETLRQVEIQAFVDGLGLSVDELMGAYNELVPASDNLVQSWRKNRTEMETLRDALDQISGTKAVTALDTLRNTISQRDALQGVVGGIDSQIGALRAGTGDASALAYLRQREAQLWAEFASTKSPAVAQAITDNTLQRIKLEGTLQAQANQSQISALKEQIAAAERLRDLAAQMGQFIQGLRAGTLSNLSSAGRLDVQRGLFQQAIASGGDVQGQAQAYLQQAQQQFGGSTAQYSAVFDQVTAQLAALGLSGAGAGQQITDAQAQINALTSVADTSLQQITALEQLRTSFSGDVADLNASIEEQTGVLRQVLTQLEATVTNQGYQITQAGEGFLRVSGSVDNLAGAIEGGALDRAQSDALGVTA